MEKQLCGGAVFKTQVGEIILQKRDNKPGLPLAGKVHVFGGRAEGKETGFEAMKREILEETGILVEDNQARLIGEIVEHTEYGSLNLVEVYLLEGYESEDLQVLEGEGHVIIKDDEEFSVSLSGLARTVLSIIRPNSRVSE